MIEWDPALRVNREFQSALVRLGFWVFGVVYVGSAAINGYYRVDWVHFFVLFGAYFVFFLGMLVSVLMRPESVLRQYLGLVLDITAVSCAIYVTGDVSPFYLLYIWIFIYAGTRYGRGHLLFASILSLLACTLTLFVLDAWRSYPYEVVFFLLLLAVLPVYQYSLLRKLQEARHEAELANRAKGDFLAVMTHELRTPLTGVVGMTNLLQSTELSAEQREYVDSISSSAEVLRALIGDVLDLSKIEARELRFESIAFDLRVCMQEVCAALASQALAKGVELILRVDPQISGQVIGDQLRVRQILFNLVGNAIKFTDQGEIRVRATASPPDGQPAEPYLLLEVEDTGIGIPEDKLNEIFEGFRQADASTTRRYGGTGLGTTIARDLTRLMGGRIGVESEVGKGCRFWARLPLQGEATPARPGDERDHRLDGRHALVFEINATSRALIVETLQDAGMTCEPVCDIAYLEHMTGPIRPVDLLVVADAPDRQDMPALLDRMRRVLGVGVPHLMLTYSARRTDGRATCPNCLNKPFLAETLVGQVRVALGMEAPQSDGQADVQSAQPLPTRGLPVLVAEDNAIAAKVIKTFLERQGCIVTLVGDGEQALIRARDEDFAIAFIDVNMPKLDGIALTRAYRAGEKPGVRFPIVALTASVAEEVKAQCIEAGMDDFLGKPVNQQELSAMIGRYAVATKADLAAIPGRSAPGAPQPFDRFPAQGK